MVQRARSITCPLCNAFFPSITTDDLLEHQATNCRGKRADRFPISDAEITAGAVDPTADENPYKNNAAWPLIDDRQKRQWKKPAGAGFALACPECNRLFLNGKDVELRAHYAFTHPDLDIPGYLDFYAADRAVVAVDRSADAAKPGAGEPGSANTTATVIIAIAVAVLIFLLGFFAGRLTT